MLFGVFRPQTTTEDKKVTNSERSASQIYRVVQRWVARSRRACPERSRRNLEGAYSTHAVGTLSTTEARTFGGPATVRRSGTDLGIITVHVTFKCVPQEEFSSRAWVVEKLRTALT